MGFWNILSNQPLMFWNTLLLQNISIKVEEKVYSIDDVFGDIIDEYGEAAALLKGLRHRENLTQVEFAEKISVTQANLSAIENGKRTIGKDIAKRIAKIFNIDYRYLL